MARPNMPTPPPRDLFAILDQIDVLLADLRAKLDDDNEPGTDDNE